MLAERGTDSLVEVAAGVYAYLQQGSWGFNNAGLIAGAESSLLVDTLYDLRLTERMLAEMRRREKAAERIDTVVNTHANGDHCFGNQLLAGAEIVSSRLAAEEMQEVPPRLMFALTRGAALLSRLPPSARRVAGLLGRAGVPYLGPLSEAAGFIEQCFGAFDFRGIVLTPPTRTFEDRLDLTVNDRPVELIRLGPAHTRGDLIAHLPQERVVFAGDILFIGTHPIAWEGPVENWIAACDRILELDPEVIVPGHGPITDRDGVLQTRNYFERVLDAARRGYRAGVPPDEVARELLASGRADWTEGHRMAVNVDTVYRQLAGDRSHRDPLDLFARMGRLESTQKGR